MCHNLVIFSCKKFKQVAASAQGVGVECETEAMTQVGDILREVMKKDDEAQVFYNSAVLFASKFGCYAINKMVPKSQSGSRPIFLKELEGRCWWWL